MSVREDEDSVEEEYLGLSVGSSTSNTLLRTMRRSHRSLCGKAAIFLGTVLVISCIALLTLRSIRPLQRSASNAELLGLAIKPEEPKIIAQVGKKDIFEARNKWLAEEMEKDLKDQKNKSHDWRAKMAVEVKKQIEQEQKEMRKSQESPPPPKNEACKTAVKDDECFKTVIWAKYQGGIKAHPDWFQGLTTSSIFEDIQLHLHNDPNSKVHCQKPCPPPPEPCHTAIKGEKCFESVMWALTGGIAKKPEWFPGLNPKSSFEDVQNHYHSDAGSDGTCKKPCPPCHTTVEGEKCYSSVMWALKEGGIAQHPEWFKELTPKSTVEAVQNHFFNDPKSRSRQCPRPCM